MPSGKLMPPKAVAATSWMVTFWSGEPATLNLPPSNSMSSSEASSMCAAIFLALSTTFSAAMCTATPPTARLREP